MKKILRKKMNKLSKILDILVPVLGAVTVFFVIACMGYAVCNAGW